MYISENKNKTKRNLILILTFNCKYTHLNTHTHIYIYIYIYIYNQVNYYCISFTVLHRIRVDIPWNSNRVSSIRKPKTALLYNACIRCNWIFSYPSKRWRHISFGIIICAICWLYVGYLLHSMFFSSAFSPICFTVKIWSTTPLSLIWNFLPRPPSNPQSLYRLSLLLSLDILQANTSITPTFSPLSFNIVQWSNHNKLPVFRHDTSLNSHFTQPLDPIHHHVNSIFYHDFPFSPLLQFSWLSHEASSNLHMWTVTCIFHWSSI